MMRRAAWLRWSWLGLAASVRVLAAQSPPSDHAAVPPATAELVVLVQDTVGRPLAEARVTAWPGGAVQLTDAQGRAWFAGLPADTVRVEVGAIGYEPRRLTGVLRAGVSATLTVALTPLAFLLDPLVVERERAATARLEGFQRRRRGSLGVFLDRDAIEARRAIRSTELLLGIPGVHVAVGANGSPGRVTMRRAGGQIGKMAGGCAPVIYLDGVAVEGGDQAGAGDGVLHNLPPDEVAGIEVYRGLAGVPPEYARTDAGCGVILIWTRGGDR